MLDKYDINASLGDLVPPSASVQVKEAVISNLRILIPGGLLVDKGKMNTLNFAVNRLCEVKSIEEIDWLALTGLAAHISYLWNTNFLK